MNDTLKAFGWSKLVGKTITNRFTQVEFLIVDLVPSGNDITYLFLLGSSGLCSTISVSNNEGLVSWWSIT